MVEVQVAVDNGDYLIQIDVQLGKQPCDLDAIGLVELIEKCVPESDAGLDQNCAVRVLDEESVHGDRSTEVGRRVVGGKLDSGEVEPFDPGHSREGHRSHPAAGSGVCACHMSPAAWQRSLVMCGSILRDFRPGDQGELRLLILAGLRERWGESFDADRNPDLSDFVANYLRRGSEVVVIERDGELIGTGTLIPDKGGAGRIVRMSVAQSHRRQGHARRIIDELIKRARRREMSEVRVLTDTPWDSAVDLYRACGFMELGDDGIDTHFRIEL